MTKILLFVPIVAILLSCSIIPQALDGSQKINIRVWRNRTPDLLNNAQDDVFYIDNREEKVVEFDISIQDNTIFMAYTTDKKVTTIKKPSDDTLRKLGLPANRPIEGPITKVSLIQDNKQLKTLYWRTDSAGKESGPFFFFSPSLKEGVWVRIFKGQFNANDKNPTITWSLAFETEEPMSINNIKIAHINSRNLSIVAVSNETELIVFNDPDQNDTINFLSTGNSFEGFANISQINSWKDGNDTYISAIGNKNTLVTGFYRNINWQETYKSTFSHTISNMQVTMGKEIPYSVWCNNRNTDISLMIYNKKKSLQKRWLELDNITSGKLPYLLINTFTDNKGIYKELVYSGIIDQRTDYFQLFRVNDFQLALYGPIILDWNERYGIGVNNLNQVLFVRALPNHNLIFSGLNSRIQWDQIQISNPPRVRINVSSPLIVKFLNGVYPITFFIQENGSMYALGGEQ